MHKMRLVVNTRECRTHNRADNNKQQQADELGLRASGLCAQLRNFAFNMMVSGPDKQMRGSTLGVKRGYLYWR